MVAAFATGVLLFAKTLLLKKRLVLAAHAAAFVFMCAGLQGLSEQQRLPVLV